MFNHQQDIMLLVLGLELLKSLMLKMKIFMHQVIELSSYQPWYWWCLYQGFIINHMMFFLFKPLLYGIQFWPCDQSYDTQLGFVHTFFPRILIFHICFLIEVFINAYSWLIYIGDLFFHCVVMLYFQVDILTLYTYKLALCTNIFCI